MGIKQLKVDVNELTVGMFVSGLDRPWTQTPFPLQGFYIKTMEEIKELHVHCRHVYIDVVKGPSPASKLKTLTNRVPTVSQKAIRSQKTLKISNLAPVKIDRNAYPVSEKLDSEIGRAKQLHQQVFSTIGSIMTHVDSEHSRIPISDTRRVASDMVDSVIRSPDAFTWLTRVREADEYTYSHAVRSAVWGILFGRHIGMPKSELDILAMGLLLKDIGKTRIAQRLIEKSDRTPAEQQEYETFIDHGVDILRKLPDIKPRVTSVVKTHCERINGSGFPSHLRGDKIPLLGKIAGLVTFYDETINPRGNATPMTPSKAVAKLYELRDIEFQGELVVEFIRAIGLYPTGTLVELSSGEVAVVVEQNFDRRLKPVVMVVTDSVKAPLNRPVILDLAEHDRAIQDKVDAGKALNSELDRIEIIQDVEPTTLNVNVMEIMDMYLKSKGGSGGLLSLIKKYFQKG